MQRRMPFGSVLDWRRLIAEVHCIGKAPLAKSVCLETISFGLVSHTPLVLVSTLKSNGLFVDATVSTKENRMLAAEVQPLDNRRDFV